MHEKIVDIQNSFWKAYKNFLETKDVNQWCDNTGTIMEKYRLDELPVLYTFCEYQFWGFSQLINYQRVTDGVEKRQK